MNGSRLARGRMGRLALLGCVVVTAVIVMFAYRTTSAEMARLRDLHVKCAQQQEALAAQLQVIYEYKVQLEKTLMNEKSANAAAKEELQQKASHERSLRDKDSLEAMQRFNALQQNYKLLQTEQQDLKDECKKKESQAEASAKQLDELKRSSTSELEEKERQLENFKNKNIELVQEKEKLEEKLAEANKAAEESAQSVEHLQKQVIQLQRELEDAKKAAHFSVGGLKTENSILQRPSNDAGQGNENNGGDDGNNAINGNENNNGDDKSAGGQDKMQVIRPSAQQQMSVSVANSGKLAAAAPPPVSQGSPKSSRKLSPVPDRASIGLASSSSSSSSVSSSSSASANGRPASRVKLPQGVPPIPRLFESAGKEDVRPEEGAKRQAPLPELPEPAKQPRVEELVNEDEQLPGRHDEANRRHVEQADRREPDGWYKLKAGAQEVGDPHHLEKNGFENGGGNEDVEQYDDYNYKEPQNKNSDLHLEEEEGEREDEDDYMHNNVNIVKHE